MLSLFDIQLPITVLYIKFSTESAGIIPQANIASFQYANRRAFTRYCLITAVNSFLMNVVIMNLRYLTSFELTISKRLLQSKHSQNQMIYLYDIKCNFSIHFFSIYESIFHALHIVVYITLSDMTRKVDVLSVRWNDNGRLKL